MASFSSRVGASPISSRVRSVAAASAAAQDSELVRRFNSGDDTAFVEIVTRHRARMFTLALSLLHNHADAEEIAQDTFIRAHRGLARFRGDCALTTWLQRIAFNLARNRYWYFQRRHRNGTRSFDSPINEENGVTFAGLIACPDPDPAREAAKREFAAEVAACMERLSVPQREILTLRNTLDHSYEQIGESLGISVGTVKSRIARARDVLRELLAETHGSGGRQASLAEQWFEPNRHSGLAACVFN